MYLTFFTEYGLTDATHTTLSRLRKDRLIKMCEVRELDTEGTKKDLIQFLLEWVSLNLPLRHVNSDVSFSNPA